MCLDEYSQLSSVPSVEEQRRFDLYIKPVVVFNVSTRYYWSLCRYLAGFFEANLIEDELIMYWVHLCSTTKSHFVYDDES